MAEDKVEPLKLEDIKDFVRDTVKELIGTGKKQPDTKDDNTPDDISAKVTAEIARIKKQEEAENWQKDVNTKLDTLSKPPKEKPPVERRRVHKVMGWGEPPQ